MGITLNIEVTSSSEFTVNSDRLTWHEVPEDWYLGWVYTLRSIF